MGLYMAVHMHGLVVPQIAQSCYSEPGPVLSKLLIYVIKYNIKNIKRSKKGKKKSK